MTSIILPRPSKTAIASEAKQFRTFSTNSACFPVCLTSFSCLLLIFALILGSAEESGGATNLYIDPLSSGNHDNTCISGLFSSRMASSGKIPTLNPSAVPLPATSTSVRFFLENERKKENVRKQATRREQAGEPENGEEQGQNRRHGGDFSEMYGDLKENFPDGQEVGGERGQMQGPGKDFSELSILTKNPVFTRVMDMKKRFMDPVRTRLENPGGRFFVPYFRRSERGKSGSRNEQGKKEETSSLFSNKKGEEKSKNSQQNYWVGYRLGTVGENASEEWYLGLGFQRGEQPRMKEGQNRDVVKKEYSGPIIGIEGRY
ncbi:MAG: hypothetical protein WA705_14870 [Candidatus Ozemobacteraceae bacterium]